LDLANFKGVTEFYEETNYLERYFMFNAVQEYEREEAEKLNRMLG